MKLFQSVRDLIVCILDGILDGGIVVLKVLCEVYVKAVAKGSGLRAVLKVDSVSYIQALLALKLLRLYLSKHLLHCFIKLGCHILITSLGQVLRSILDVLLERRLRVVVEVVHLLLDVLAESQLNGIDLIINFALVSLRPLDELLL